MIAPDGNRRKGFVRGKSAGIAPSPEGNRAVRIR
jgi:hypothetical protein